MGIVGVIIINNIKPINSRQNYNGRGFHSIFKNKNVLKLRIRVHCLNSESVNKNRVTFQQPVHENQEIKKIEKKKYSLHLRLLACEETTAKY